MPDNVSISINGQSRVPPGFRFHPTEEELLQYYLKKKARSETIDLDVIVEIDLNKLEPWDIKEKCQIGGSTLQNDWYFFSHKDKKYPTGTRTNRATIAGFWKATGRDKVIYGCGGAGARIGMRKTLVFYTGRAPLGLKSDWIMHEYRLCDDDDSPNEERWVICKIFRKKHKNKSQDLLTTVTGNYDYCSTEPNKRSDDNQNSGNDFDGTLEQIFQHIRPKQSSTDSAAINNREEDHSHPTNNILTAGNPLICHNIVSNRQYSDNEYWKTTELYDGASFQTLCLENNPTPNNLMNSQLGFYSHDHDSVYQIKDGFSGGYQMQNLIYSSDEVGCGAGTSDWTTMDYPLMITQLNSASQNQLQEVAAAEFNAENIGLCASATLPSYHDENNGYLQLPAVAFSSTSSSPSSLIYSMQPPAQNYVSNYSWIDPLSTLT